MEWLIAGEWVNFWMRAMARASLYGGLAIAGAWLVCRCLPRMTPTARSWIWRIVYLKLILLVLWPIPIRMPLLPRPDVQIEQAESLAWVSASQRRVPGAFRNAKLSEWQSFPQETVRHAARFLPIVFLVIWLAGILCFAIRMIRSTFATQRTRRESQLLTDPRLRQECEVLSRYVGLKQTPDLLNHGKVSSPQAMGLLRPAVLFPDWFFDRFSTREVQLVLAHELAHLRRRDPLWAWVRRMVNGVLFFHPLVWVAHEQAILAEEIVCDEIAVRGIDATISDYAGTLLRVTEESFSAPQSATALLGTGMSRTYRAMASRLQALRQLGRLYSRVARWRKWWATSLGCLAVAALLPLGLMTIFHTSGIRQLDPRYPVLGYKISRGHSHALSVKREVCRFAGLKLSRVAEDAGPAQPRMGAPPGEWASTAWTTTPNAPGSSVPVRVTGWLRKLGLKPQLDTAAYSSGVFVGTQSYAVIVRFAHDPRCDGYQNIEAYLVDEHGETIPLVPHRSEFPPQSGEYVKFWVLSPIPITRAKFTLLLRLATEGKDVAVLGLGEL
ncbi:MAG: hypothetical protein DME26_07255 [Verrucomicrobia bacterium]|nr:MAG: hypothetical protein DME26_07255 [Verrucomicrobiota bacterium]